MKEIPAFCTLCRSQCGTLNVVDNGRLVAIKPDPSHPTGAAMCMKGKSGPEAVDASNRVLYPLRRTQPKGTTDPGWERIGWEEALDTVASKLSAIRRESGAEAVAFGVTTKSGTAIADSVEWVDRFVRVFGSPNVAGAVEICNWHKDNAHKFTFGVGTPPADYANADLILLWGHNPTSTWLAQSEAIARGRARGAKLLVVDPRETPLAASADVWLQVKPGTDAALALGLSALLIEARQFDHDFVQDWTNGPLLVDSVSGRFLKSAEFYDDKSGGFMVWNKTTRAPAVVDTALGPDAALLRTCALHGTFKITDLSGQPRSCRPAFDLFAEACRKWTPQAVASECDIAEDDLRRAAALIALNRKMAYHAWNGVGQGLNATQTERAIATLYALRGVFDEIGANRIYAKQPVNRVDALSLLDPTQLTKALGVDARPLGPPAEGRIKPVDAYSAMRTRSPYRIRAFVGFGTNHIMTQTDVEETIEGLKACEFHVHCEMTMTPTASYADIVLPICTPWERESLRVGFEISEEAENLIQLRPAMVPKRGESRTDLAVIFDLACRLGHADKFFDGDIEAGWNHILEPLGISVQDLRDAGGRIRRPLHHLERKYAQQGKDGGVAGFPTQTRRVEFYSELLLRNAYAPVPVHAAGVQPDNRYPLLLTSMKNGYFCHSEHRSVPSLRRRSPDPMLYMHPDLGERRGIAEGSWVTVKSEAGSAQFKCKFDLTLRPEVMAADYGFWEDTEALGIPARPYIGIGSSNFNALVSASMRDPVSGSTNHKAVRCEIVPDDSLPSKDWAGFRDFVVTHTARPTDQTLEIEVSAQGNPLPNYLPGQYIRIRLPDTSGLVELVRAYSLIGPSHVDNRTSYRICVQREALRADIPGRMSGYLHGSLRIGQVLGVSVPRGVFTIPLRSRRPLILIATGIGITPFLGYLESVAAQGTSPEVALIYGNTTVTSHAYRSRIETLKRRLPGLTVHYFYSRMEGRVPEGVHAGRIDLRVLSEPFLSKRPYAYICGSAAVVTSMKSQLFNVGLPRTDVFSELFVSESPQIDFSAQKQALVEFRRAGKTVTWNPGDGSILSLAERSGIRAPSGCRVGQCESCAAKVISGAVRHLHGQTPEEENVILTCQAIPDTDLCLDL